MHICQLLPELNQGGVERGTVELNRALVRRGHRSTVISAGGQLVGEIERDGGTHLALDVCSKNPLTVPARVMRLRQVIRDLAPDILHARSRVPAWLCRFANRGLGIPFVTTVHGFNSVGRYSAIMTQGDAVICVSNPVKEYIQRHYRTPDERITVIHRGIDPAEFDPARLDHAWMEGFRAEHGLAGRYVVTAVGRITELKDYETFIRAMAGLGRAMPDSLGLIVGGAWGDKQGYLERLKGLVRELGAEGRVLFAGSQRNMAEVYALSDLLVSSSKKPESFGRTLIEAMAMGTPVVAAAHGGSLDIVQEGVSGLLFRPGDEEDLQRQIERARGMAFGDLRGYVTAHFTLDRMVTLTVAVYERLLVV